MMGRRLVLPSLVLAALLAALLVVVWWPQGKSNGSVVQGGDFALNTVQGPLTLQQLRGKVVILYFGYTWCPDVCPTSLGLLGLALHKLTPAELDAIQPVFISVDPERDTVERLAEYTRYFHPRLLGATGSPQQIADVARRYGVAYARDQRGSASEYTVDHSSLTFILDQNGKVREILPHGTSPDNVVAAIRLLM